MYFNVTNVFYNYMHLDFWISKYCVKKALWASQERLRTWDLQVMVSFWWCTRHGEFLYRLRCWNLPWSSRTPSAWVQWVRRPFKNSRLRKEKVTPTTSLLLHQMWLSLFHLLPGHPVDCLLSLKQQSAKEWKPCAKNQWESDVGQEQALFLSFGGQPRGRTSVRVSCPAFPHSSPSSGTWVPAGRLQAPEESASSSWVTERLCAWV